MLFVIMPWKAESGKEYLLCLLDTNAISEILKNTKLEGKNFFERYPPTSIAPCFTIYNLIELRRNQIVYEKFLIVFSIYPIFLLKTQKMIVDAEIENYDRKEEVSSLYNAFSYFGKSESYNLESFIDKYFQDPDAKEMEKTWRANEADTLAVWLAGKQNFSPNENYPNTKDAERYMEEAAVQTIINQNMEWAGSIIKSGQILDIDRLPSIKMMLYSLYYRLYDPSWKPMPSEVTDISIIAATPYVDIFITEKFQANIMDKIKSKVKNLDVLEVKRIRDLR